jgi:sigma-B regulation protein RsbU (phosphoserine phosphatase)
MNDEEQKVILLVDDTPVNIQMVQAILKDSYRIRVATNGLKALALASSEPIPDLILLDVSMPGMDGFEVCTRLKASLATREIPVIFLTGQTEIEDETKGFEVGGVDYIHKPFSSAVVKARVHTHLALRGIREQLSHQLAAIRNELETARQIQLSILPGKMPGTNGLDLAARYLPMTAVAGDFYDFILVDDNHVGVLVADVSGHGMPAALISSMLKIALAAQSTSASDPAQVLLGLNQALCGKFQGHFVTAAYVFIDMENNILRYAGAGHPPLITKDNAAAKVNEMLENGLFLGAFPHATYTSVEVPFKTGDWCLLYTDGIPETTNPAGEEFGTNRLKLFLQNDESRGSNAFVDRFLETLYDWANQPSHGEADDDITLLAIHCIANKDVP